MKKKELADLSDDELLHEEKNRKSGFIFLMISLLVMVVVAVLNSLDRGVGIFTFLPLVFIPIMINNWNKYKEVLKEKEVRNMK